MTCLHTWGQMCVGDLWLACLSVAPQTIFMFFIYSLYEPKLLSFLLIYLSQVYGSSTHIPVMRRLSLNTGAGCEGYYIQYHLDVLETNIWKGLALMGLFLSLSLVTML